MLPKSYYDPVKAHEYYERTKKLKGRRKSSSTSSDSSGSSGSSSGGSRPSSRKSPTIRQSPKLKKAQARVSRLQGKVRTLETALSEAQAALVKKRQSAREQEKKNSDGKSTAKERQASKEYRDKHKEELATKRKKAESSSSSKPSSKSVSDMSAQELRTRISKIKVTLREAKRQLSSASSELGQLAHSAIASEPNANEHFARFKSAERIPSK